jgi:hypothetical protein
MDQDLRIRNTRQRPTWRADYSAEEALGILMRSALAPKLNEILIAERERNLRRRTAQMDAFATNGKLGIVGIDVWRRVLPFIASQERTRASVVCEAFLSVTNEARQSAVFKFQASYGAAFGVSHPANSMAVAHRRFPALCDVTLVLDGVLCSAAQLEAEYLTFTSITALRLESLELAELPACIGALSRLRALTLSNNWFYFEEDEGERDEEEQGAGMLTTLPDSIGALACLTSLQLDGNHLTALPETMGSLTGLTELNVENNCLATLPDSICALTGLTELNLSSNRLTALPDAIGRITGLTHLHLDFQSFAPGPHGSTLRWLPDSIGALKSLKHLNLSCNALRALPDTICALTQIDELSLFMSGEGGFTIPRLSSLAVRAWIADTKNDLGWRHGGPVSGTVEPYTKGLEPHPGPDSSCDGDYYY